MYNIIISSSVYFHEKNKFTFTVTAVVIYALYFPGVFKIKFE